MSLVFWVSRLQIFVGVVLFRVTVVISDVFILLAFLGHLVFGIIFCDRSTTLSLPLPSVFLLLFSGLLGFLRGFHLFGLWLGW